MSVPKRRSNCWLLTLLVLHGTMWMLWKCVMRRKQKEEKEQRWAASRKPLPHIITLDYTLQWGPNAARCLQSRKTGLKGTFKLNFDWLNWPYPSLCSSCQSRDVTNTYDLFKTWSTWRADITHIHVCSGSSQRRHQELQGSLVEQNMLLLLLNWMQGRFNFKFSMFFFPLQPLHPREKYKRKKTQALLNTSGHCSFIASIWRRTVTWGDLKSAVGIVHVFFPAFFYLSIYKQRVRKEEKWGRQWTMFKARFVPWTLLLNAMPFNQRATRENLYSFASIYNSTVWQLKSMEKLIWLVRNSGFLVDGDRGASIDLKSNKVNSG